MTATRRCERCLQAGHLVRAYWGPDLCGPCCLIVAERHDKFHTWPPFPSPP